MDSSLPEVDTNNATLRERRFIRKKLLKESTKEESWRKRKGKRKRIREMNLLKQMKLKEESSTQVDECISEKFVGNQKRFYRLSIALPGSIMNNAQSPELRTYLAGQVQKLHFDQIARAAAVFCVDEVVVFDETARMKPEELKAYRSGSWYAEKPIREDNVECNFHMARILEFLECPQYLRKTLFPLQRALKNAGVLNPLDCMHHLRSTDLSIPYREGVVLNKPVKKGRGPLCNVGLEKELQLDSEIDLPPGTRVTVRVTTTDLDANRLRGSLISARRVRDESGIYWGYNVRVASSLSDAIYGAKYDIVIGTSERGEPIDKFELLLSEGSRVLLVFGGLDGLEAAVEADENIRESDPAELFKHYLNSVPGQGSRTIRTEEAIPITLAAVKLQLDTQL
uniref:Methyltransferase n=1 Tax=Parascaris univalens TaxID=6257 RepID=A0A915ASM1_PARUN